MKSIIRILKKYVLRPIVCALITVGLMASPVFAKDLLPKEMLSMAEELLSKASQMAVKAQATYDYYMAQHAFVLTLEAADWVGEATTMAQQMPDSELGSAANNATNKIRKVIIHAQTAAGKIAATNQDPEVVHAANFLFKSCELALMQFANPPQE